MAQSSGCLEPGLEGRQGMNDGPAMQHLPETPILLSLLQQASRKWRCSQANWGVRARSAAGPIEERALFQVAAEQTIGVRFSQPCPCCGSSRCSHSGPEAIRGRTSPFGIGLLARAEPPCPASRHRISPLGCCRASEWGGKAMGTIFRGRRHGASWTGRFGRYTSWLSGVFARHPLTTPADR